MILKIFHDSDADQIKPSQALTILVASAISERSGRGGERRWGGGRATELISLVNIIISIFRTVDSAVTEIFLADVVITSGNIKYSDIICFLLIVIPPALSTEINVGLSPVGSDDQREPGGSGSGV